MKNSIYFIGGASASGKSVVTKMLSERDAWPIIELDPYYDLLSQVITDQDDLEKVTGKIALQVVTQLLDSNARCLVEGGWITPSQARKLKEDSGGRFYPVYCGYPQASVKARFAMIKTENRHWLARESKKAAYAFLQDQIKGSEWYRKECKKHDLPFFDFSNVEEGANALITHYTVWRQSLD